MTVRARVAVGASIVIVVVALLGVVVTGHCLAGQPAAVDLRRSAKSWQT
jgi:hypothetical protein